MNPMLLQLLARFGPRAAGLLGSAGARMGMINIPDVPPVSPTTPGALSTGPAPPISGPQTPDMTPAARVAQGWDQFAPPMPAPQVVPPAPAPAPAVPTPQPRPDVPAPDPMGFFQRNAAMMRDPSSGAFIDPTSAERAQASGPDVINKLLQMFHQKDMT
jgi:hypothetical protein